MQEKKKSFHTEKGQEFVADGLYPSDMGRHLNSITNKCFELCYKCNTQAQF